LILDKTAGKSVKNLRRDICICCVGARRKAISRIRQGPARYVAVKECGSDGSPGFLNCIQETKMIEAMYQKGNWKAQVGVEELASGKFQGIVLLLHEGSPSTEQIEHRTVDVNDTIDGALAEAKVLAQRVLGNL
jgi:hypothetical protein